MQARSSLKKTCQVAAQYIKVELSVSHVLAICGFSACKGKFAYEHGRVYKIVKYIMYFILFNNIVGRQFSFIFNTISNTYAVKIDIIF